MKLFWIKNKVLITTLLAVLALGFLFWGGLRLFEGEQMQDAFYNCLDFCEVFDDDNLNFYRISI